MAKKVFAMYLAKEGNPNSDAYAKLDLPASPWELWDALDKVRLQTDDILYMEIEDYYAFEHLAPHLDGLEISLNELNDLVSFCQRWTKCRRSPLTVSCAWRYRIKSIPTAASSRCRICGIWRSAQRQTVIM